mmetsp:Transcript_2682/g.8347  ORF Transcript_2682/g.8347 Transcript_2682/m.8347 type:complete len:232 (-) Transcript_2682:2422-3117(-)
MNQIVVVNRGGQCKGQRAGLNAQIAGASRPPHQPSLPLASVEYEPHVETSPGAARGRVGVSGGGVSSGANEHYSSSCSKSPCTHMPMCDLRATSWYPRCCVTAFGSAGATLRLTRARPSLSSACCSVWPSGSVAMVKYLELPPSLVYSRRAANTSVTSPMKFHAAATASSRNSFVSLRLSTYASFIGTASGSVVRRASKSSPSGIWRISLKLASTVLPKSMKLTSARLSSG